MHKTKLGISVGLLGAIIYFSAAFSGGYIVAIILCGYVLLVEDNPWLRKTSVKSVLLMVAFSLLTFVLNVVPDLTNMITTISNITGKYISSNIISSIDVILDTIVGIIRSIVFIVLGIKALNQGIIKLPLIDKIIDKYMD